jgi:hypothetical protein
VIDYINSLDEHTRLKAFRTKAAESFEAASWPTTEEEEWRRTDLSVFDLDGLGTPDADLRKNTAVEIKHGTIHRLNDLLSGADGAVPEDVVDRIFAEFDRMIEKPRQPHHPVEPGPRRGYFRPSLPPGNRERRTPRAVLAQPG